MSFELQQLSMLIFLYACSYTIDNSVLYD